MTYSFDIEALEGLRARVAAVMSEKRFFHTAKVEEMIVRLGALYCPEQIPMLRAAALLHDITKEYSAEQGAQVLVDHGISVTKQDILTPKTLHARTAALIIPERFGLFAAEPLLRAVRYHTTGRADMTIEEKLLYLADYIDESRKFPDCVMLRKMFWEAKPEDMTAEEQRKHLDRVLVRSFDMTIMGLLSDGTIVSEDTFAARNFLLLEG